MSEIITFTGLKELWEMKCEGKKLPTNWKSLVYNYLDNKINFLRKKPNISDHWIRNLVYAFTIAENNFGLDTEKYWRIMDGK